MVEWLKSLALVCGSSRGMIGARVVTSEYGVTIVLP